MLAELFNANGIIHQEFVLGVRLWTVNFIKRWIRDWSLEYIALRLSTRKVGSSIYCTTMHGLIIRAMSLSFWRKQESPCYPIHLLHWFSAGWLLFPKLKIASKGTIFVPLSSSHRTVTREQKAMCGETFSRPFDSLYEQCKRCAEAGREYIEWWC
jgi:hypothetical protein